MGSSQPTIIRKTCRISNEKLVDLFSLGKIHVSDFIASGKKPHLPPIDLKLCLAPKSGLVQLAHTAPSDEMYRHYWYRSGTNATMTKELEQIAKTTQGLIKTKAGDMFIDIGCNDGTLLSFVDPNLIRIGFDPAKNGYKELSKKHADLIIEDYFNYPALAKSRYGKKKAMIITSIAMFYDLENPNKFVKDITRSLDDNGLWVIQMSYLPLMLQQLAFDNVCVKPDTIILGDNKPINAVSRGNYAIGGNGKLAPVFNTMKRFYKGRLIRIKPRYLEPIAVTAEHPVLIARKNFFRFNCGQTKPKSEPYHLEWVPAKEVKRGDYTVMPKLRNDKNAKKIVLTEFNNLNSPHYRRGLLSLPLTVETAWFLGLYVAEGHVGGKSNNPYINFTLNVKEQDIFKRIDKIAKSLGYRTSSRTYEYRKSLEVRIVCAALARALKDWVGKRAIEKRIPDFIMFAPRNIKTAFLQGLFEGDGYIRGNKVHFHTSSKTLALQAQLLVASLDGLLGISYVKPYEREIRGGRVVSKDSWQLRGSSKALAKIFGYKHNGPEIQHAVTEKDYILVPVKNVDTEPYDGLVHNIETANESYLVSNAVVHNCHEHLEYYSLSSFINLLGRHRLKVVDCTLNDVNGGSFRIYVRKIKADPACFATAPYRDVARYRVQTTLSHEQKLNLNKPEIYLDFYKKSENLKNQVVSFIKKEKKKGKTIWGYGASTKGNTLLQWFGLDNSLIDGIAERSPTKFGLRTVGTNIPIYSEEKMRKSKPDYLLILPWHFISEFKEREARFLERGGKFIVPCPKFEIIGR